jgi:hypothetical protein
VGLVLAAVLAVVPGVGPAAALDSTQIGAVRSVTTATIGITGVTPATTSGHVGVDVLLGSQDYSPCSNPSETYRAVCDSGYYDVHRWTPSGSDFSSGMVVRNAEGGVTHNWANKMTKAHVELYPYGPGGAYDPWTQTTGGAALWVGGFTSSAGAARSTPEVGAIPLPQQGRPGTGRLTGTVVSNAAVTTDRLGVAFFQQGDGAVSSGGVGVQGFAALGNRGSAWTSGYVYDGEYIVFIEDRLRDTKIVGFVTIAGATTVDLDLEATCFGLDTCEHLAGTPTVTSGGFHPVTPGRVLDTRVGIGHPAEKVHQGDGASADPNPDVRRAAAVNHEVRVTGAFGVPTTGVAAVVLNVTAVAPTEPSHLTIFPKPARRSLYDDQSSYGQVPEASNLNVVRGQTVPNLVVAKVGAGGKVRVDNHRGDTDLVFDVVGWFDTGAGTTGDVFTGVTPTRLLDTRSGPSNPPAPAPLGAGVTRVLPVTGGGGPVPATATAVVVNVTATGASSASHLTVWPAGVTMPVASNLNFVAGQTVPNLVTVRVGAGGAISLFNNAGTTHVVVDVVGYYAPGAVGRLTPSSPARLLDTRSGLGGPSGAFGDGETRLLQVGGAGPVPPGAKAVVLNVTVTGPTASSHLTVFPADAASMPTASNLNFVAGQTVPNLVVVRVSGAGRVALYNNDGATHVIADVVAWYT